MDTPRPRGDGGQSPPGASGETLPFTSVPRSCATEAKAELEAEMVAVVEKMNKAAKLLPRLDPPGCASHLWRGRSP